MKWRGLFVIVVLIAVGCKRSLPDATQIQSLQQTNMARIERAVMQLNGLNQPQAIVTISNAVVEAGEGTTQALSLLGKAHERLQTFSGRKYSVIEEGDRRLGYSYYQDKPNLPVSEVRFSTAENKTLFTIRFDRAGNVTQYFSFDNGFEMYTNGLVKSAYGNVGEKSYEARWSEDGRLVEEVLQSHDGGIIREERVSSERK